MDIILWKDANGLVVALSPPGGLTTAETIASDDVPKDRPHVVIDDSLLPEGLPADWLLQDDGTVIADPAKQLANEQAAQRAAMAPVALANFNALIERRATALEQGDEADQLAAMRLRLSIINGV